MTSHTQHSAPTAGIIHPPIDPAWLPWSQAFTRTARTLSGRKDLTVICTPGAGAGSPGLFTFSDATIEIDASVLRINPTQVDPAIRRLRTLYAAGFGVLVHECGHAQHSRPYQVSEPAAAYAADLLDEPRIEAQQIRRRPQDRRWLHAATTQIILRDLSPHDDRWTAACAAALLLARTDAGVLQPHETAALRRQIIAVLGRKLLRKLTTIWQRALRTRDDDTAAMLEWGRRWCRALGTPPAGPIPVGHGPATGIIWTTAQSVINSIAAGLVQDADLLNDELAAEKARAQTRKSEKDTKDSSKKAAEKVFGKASTVRTGRGGNNSQRPPTEAEKTAARQLTRAIRAAAHREPLTTTATATSALPPGRLHTRAALSEQVQRSLGQNPTSQPWKTTIRKHQPQPPLAVGIVVDVSVSMGSFLRPAASAAWIIADAAGRLPGTTSACVTFGSQLTAITRPGPPPAMVTDYQLEPSTLGFLTAVDAVDHILGLSARGDAARLLAIISDGELPATDCLWGDARLKRLAASGCALLWLGPPNTTPLGGAPLTELSDTTALGSLLISAATAALTGTSRPPTR